MPLTMVNSGETVGISRITGTDVVRQHLTELGFIVGDKVTVVSNVGGNLIVQVKDARIALDMKMANRIMAA
ncbi:MAG: ferrous iron transport protein A [Blautia sp.]|nr:ferrous iron transport protein A [Aeriscardovia sp.]MBQ1491746.1 ferrous iron transport protein A [Blautia sp.]